MKLHLMTLAALATLAACGTVPDPNPLLEQARERHAALSGDAMVARHAADELRVAGVALRRAEAAHAEAAERAEVDHLAYMAGQRLSIAQETAAARSAQAVTAGAAAERDRLRLATRTAEADAARRDLVSSETSAARTSAELADSRQAAAATQARLENRDARVDSLEQELRALNARQTDQGLVVTLGDVLFDTGQSRLQAGGVRGLQQLADVMRRHPELRASIEGHTDDVGGADSNQALSEQRARSVMAALVNLGVGADRLQSLGRGESRPLVDNGSAAGRQMNRRVEVIVLPGSAPVSAR